MKRAPRETPRWRKRAWRGVMLAVPVTLLTGLWWQHEALLQSAAGRALGAEATLSGLRLIDGPTLDYLGLRDPAAGTAPMLLSAENLRLEWGEGGVRAERMFDRMTVERLRLMAATAPTRNYGFVSDFLSAPATGFDPLPYLPRSVAVDELVIALETAGASLSLEGLAAELDVATLGDLELRLLGENVRADWLVENLTIERQSTSGSVAADLTLREGAAALRGSVALPGLLEATISGTASTGNDWSASLTLPSGKLEGPVWSRMLTDSIGYPVRFDRLELADGALDLEGATLRSVSLRMSTESIVVGQEEATQYSGPAVLRIEGDQGTALAGRATLSLEGAPDLSFELVPEDAGFQVRLAESDWNRAQLTQILPPTYRDYLGYWPGLAGLRLEEAAWQSSGNLLNATGSARTADAAALRLALEAGLGASALSLALTAGGDQLGTATLALDPEGVALSLDKTPLDRWMGSILGYPGLALPGVLTGSLKQGMPGDDGKKPLILEAKLDLPENTQGTAQLTADLVPDGARVEGVAGKLALAEAMTLNLRGGSIALSPLSFNLPLRGNVDLAALGRLMNGEWPSGRLEFSGAVANHAEGYRLRGGEASLAALTIGDIALPEEPFRIKGDLEWGKDGSLRAPAMDVAWSDTFTAQAKGLRWASTSAWRMDELKASGTYGLLTAMGVFDTADTTFEVSATGLGADEAGFRGHVEGHLQGGFVLPEALLAAVDLKLSLQGELGGDGAAGPLEAQELAAFGVTLRDTTARARFDWPEVFLDDIATRLFEGTARGSMRVDLAGENYPVVVDATLENLDLAVFTREFKPPDTELSGLVSGSIHAAIAGESITELDVKLISGEGFTLNRAMVAQILMQQQVGDITGSGTVSKIVERVIGSEDARPFTGAELNLGIVDGRIAGQALLKSKSLNLTVDIKADQKALFEAMRMRQEGQVAGIKTTLN